ncbi:MAG: hypothetical protein N4A33_02060 [Bacteriovoracaceae bacterium]|jgi:hypothetical protein|nr:hypothetical protein [Bacteriovoracaceae bacterium]
MTRIVILLFGLISSGLCFELTLIHDVSRSKQTFVTRNGKNEGIFEGKRSTFSANNVSIIAKAITVTRKFTQWEIENDFTDVPFQKGDTVTFYDTTEYLWALTPEVIKSKYIKSKLTAPKISVSITSSFVKGISESVSGVSATSDSRGGILLESLLERKFNTHYSLAAGIRYARESIQVNAATLTTQRLLGLLEAKYYFPAMEELGGAKFSLGIGIGYGQSVTTTSAASSSGDATIVPLTKITLNYPMNKRTDFLTEFGYESLSIRENFKGGTKQVTTLDNLRLGLGIKRYY